MNKFTKQCVAAVASLAMAGTLCVAGAVVAGSSAWAADTCNNGAPWSDACKTQKGSITITKYEYKGDNDKSKPLENAKFKVYKVTNFDLTDYKNWLTVASKVEAVNTNPKEANGFEFDGGSEKATGSTGEAKFDNLAIGLYKVEETEVPEGYEKLPKPFYMTIPEVTRVNNSTDNTYKYNVTVDPKNAYTKDAVKKTVDTKGMVGVKDDLPYTIESAIKTNSDTPSANVTKEDFDGFAIWDDALISAYDSIDENVVKKVSIGDNEIKNDNAAKPNYKITISDSNIDIAAGGIKTRKRITVSFTDDGLEKIAEAYKTNVSTKVKVELKFTLKDGVASGKLINKYGFQPGYKKGTPDTDKPKPVNPTPDTKSEVTLREFQIKKVNGAKESEALKGAKFAIFAKKSDAESCKNDPSRADTNCKNKSSKGFDTETETVENTGLTKSGFKAKVGETFYVVETKAPDGFALSPSIDEVTIPATESTDNVYTYTFKDLPNGGPDGGNNWFKLPKTGAAGVIIFALIGLGLVGSGMFVFLKNRKKEEEQAA
ncbi:SpaH/EbpB family LPXTG-anchored major pilin [Gardnerella vaginalis]|uniref:SpaH/EbpB family LPXTG-anchored major pilin n=1 Tax=Gardnerella vaginalis TaxID=2702 RepID=UPI0039EF638C